MITVNGTPLSTFGFLARTRSPLRMGHHRHTVLSIPGGFPVRAGSLVGPGRISVTGVMRAAATGVLPTDHTTLLANLDALALHLQGENLIRFSDFSDREWVGYLEEGSQLALHDPQWIQRSGQLTLDWVVADPRARAVAETTRTGSGALVLGTAPSPIRVEVTTATATIRVRAGGSAGTIVTELVWNGVSGALVVDGETQTVTRAGVNAIDGITAVSVFPIADPADGADYIGVPAGATVRYRPRWW